MLHRCVGPLVLVSLALALSGCSELRGGGSANKNAATAQWKAARATVLMTLARDQYSAGNFDEARKTITNAIKLLPENAEVRTLSGRIAFEQGNLELAESEFRLAQAGDPNFAQADYYLGVVMQRWQRLPAALELYTSASVKAPGEVAYVLARAETLVAMDRDAEALAFLQESQARFENSAEVRAGIGQVLMKQRRFVEAADVLRQAVLLAPEDDLVREHLARCYFRANKPQETIETIERLLRRDEHKERADLYTMLGECYLAVGRPVDARAAFETASNLQPGNVGYTLNLAKAALEVGDVRRAEITVRRALALQPNDAHANLMLGYVRMEQGKLPEALAAFRRASNADSSDPVPLCMAGVVLEKLGRPQEAMEQYAKALTVRPNDDLARKLMNQLEATATLGSDR
jgi:tetratricopeptide (TPR) repeat protein